MITCTVQHGNVLESVQ